MIGKITKSFLIFTPFVQKLAGWIEQLVKRGYEKGLRRLPQTFIFISGGGEISLSSPASASAL